MQAGSLRAVFEVQALTPYSLRDNLQERAAGRLFICLLAWAACCVGYPACCVLLWLALQLSVVLAPKSAGGLELQASSRPEQELVLACP